MPGPFISYVPPGVYTRTLFEPAVNALIDTVRLPVFIGIGEEYLRRDDYELVRGSSAVTDILLTKEDVNDTFVLDETDPANVVLGAHTGAEKKFRVAHYPIVAGSGTATTTTDPTDVKVYVNGSKVTVSSVDGTNGYVTLGSFPAVSDDVKCTYYFSRTDTQVTDDVSDQADGSNVDFKVFNIPIVDGTNGGITTTSVSDVVVKVNGTAVTVSAIDGDTGIITLETAPALSSVVTVLYYFNSWQNTFDYLPEAPTEVIRVGVAAGDSSYIEGTDFIVSDKEVHWGASYKIASGVHTTGDEYLDSTQVTVTLVDDKVYLDECAPYTDTSTSIVSDTVVRLTYVPTMGNGRDTTLGTDTFNSLVNGRVDVTTDRPDLITAYVGVDVTDAQQRAAVTVLSVDGANRLITLATPLAANEKVFATYYTNYLRDDTYTLTTVTAAGSGSGTYNVTSDLTGLALHQVLLDTVTGISQEVNWGTSDPTLPDVFHDGSGTPIEEYVMLTLASQAARGATLTSTDGPFLVTSSTNKVKIGGTTATLTSSTPAVATGTLTGATSLVKASKDLGTVGTFALDTEIEATTGGIAGNSITVALVMDAPGAVTIARVGTAFTIHAKAGVSTVANVEAAITALAGADDLFGVKTAGTGATVLAAPDAFGATALTGGNATFASDGLTLLMTSDGGTEQSFTFASDLTALNAATFINLTASGFTASGTTGALVLTNTSLGDDSSIVIGNGTANAILGFTAGTETNGAHTPIATVNSDLNTAFNPTILSTIEGSAIKLTTAATGTSATLTIATVADNAYTALGFTVGQTDGGEAAYQTYTVESFSDSGYTTPTTDGSGTGATSSGTVGQTFIDDVTGLRINLLAPTGGTVYDDGGVIKLTVLEEFVTSSTQPMYAILGTETKVSNTTGVGVGDTASVDTYDKAGSEPSVGDFYYITYKYAKDNYDAKVFTSFKDITAEYGALDPANKLTLAMFLAISNGALLVAGKQVQVATGGTDASTTDYMTAIDSLRKPIQRRYKPSVIVPLTTDQTVISFLKTHVLLQSSIRYRQERIGIFGFGEGTEPKDAQSYAKGLGSERMWCVYPETAVVGITDEYGTEVEHIVTGEMLAAALAGSNVSPAYDVATPMTYRSIVGFKRLVREMDTVEKNQTAVAGITVLEDLDPNIRVVQALTTNMSSSLTREPTVITIADFTQQVCRSALEQFIGVKFLGGVLGDIERVLKTTLRGLVNAQIIAKFSSVKATVDPSDPTSCLVEVVYVPVLPLNYIVITFNLRSR